MKLLGVELDYQLNFNEQVSRTFQKVARHLNVLQRIGKILSEETGLLFFIFCNKANTEELVKLQYRGLKIVFDSYESSYKALVARANLPTLHLGTVCKNYLLEGLNQFHSVNIALKAKYIAISKFLRLNWL